MAEKKKYESFTSPKGVAKWAHLSIPQTKIGDKTVAPNYNVTVLYTPEEAASLIEFIEKKHQAAYATAVAENGKSKRKLIDQGLNNVFANDTTKDGEPTGKVAFKFKHKAEGERKDGTKWYFKPALFDRYGVPLVDGTVIYGGSVLEVNYGVKHTVMPTGAFYTSFQLNAVMVNVLKSGMERDASQYGFNVATADAEEGQNAFGEQNQDAEVESEAVGANTDF